MKDGKDDETVAELVRILGDKNNLVSNYGVKGTWTHIDSIPRAFKNFGYEFNDRRVSLDRSFPYDLLNSRFNPDAHPLLIYGVGHEIVIGSNPVDNSSHSVHTWVADGSMTKVTKEAEGGESTEFYIHCVWGWGGVNNGYFLYTYNGVIGGKPDELASGEQRYAYEGYVYNMNLSGWTDYKPLK
ncbi:MAG: C10 family peptidase [Muribaculaceae bacterium]|nr:C10 family peptidase [Muribaculaceae bacterium]